jgi:hypothetical protein
MQVHWVVDGGSFGSNAVANDELLPALDSPRTMSATRTCCGPTQEAFRLTDAALINSFDKRTCSHHDDRPRLV